MSTDPGNRMEELPSNAWQNTQQNNFFRSPPANENSMMNSNLFAQSQNQNQNQNQNQMRMQGQNSMPMMQGPKIIQQVPQEKQSFPVKQAKFNQIPPQKQSVPLSASVQSIPKQNFYNNQQPLNQSKIPDSQFVKPNSSGLDFGQKSMTYGLVNNGQSNQKNMMIEESRGDKNADLCPLFQSHRQHLDEMTNLLRQELLMNSEVQLNPNISELEYQNKLQEILFAKLDALEKFNKILEDRKAVLSSNQGGGKREIESSGLFDLNRSMNDENKEVFLLDNV